MKATEYKKTFDGTNEHDALVDFIESGEGRCKLDALDAHWQEVMRMAERYGFITYCYGGGAILCTNAAYLEENGAEVLARRLRMQDVEL